MIDSELFRLNLQTGIYSRIARDLGLEHSHVRRVLLGQRRSAKVTAAYKAEMARINREVRKYERKVRLAA